MPTLSIVLLFISFFFPDTKINYLTNAYFCVISIFRLFCFPSVRERFTRLFLRDIPFSISWLHTPIVHHVLPRLRRWMHSIRSPNDFTPLAIPFRVAYTICKQLHAIVVSLSTPGQYTYTPLQHTPESREIRLIHLHSGCGDDPLRADILRDTLYQDKAVGNYETVSYAWDGSLKTCRLETPCGVILITPSLFYALHRFRLSDKCRMLWADAVCINQSDSAEKANQVGMMGNIYASAARALVYLGREADESEVVEDLLMRIARASPLLHALFGEGGIAALEYPGTTSLLQRAAFKRCGLPAEDDPAWKALAKLWSRPWFRRVWVIQEFVLSPDVRMFCGNWEVSWSVFYVATIDARFTPLLYIVPEVQNALECAAMIAGMSAMHIMCGYRRSALLDTMARIGEPVAEGTGMQTLTMRTETMVFKEQEKLNCTRQTDSGLRLQAEVPLLELLTLSDRSEATRARDHLFAVLGLATDADDELFMADYSTPFDEIVRRYGTAFVRKGQCMDLLYQARLNIQSLRFPSWIPDWTTKFIYMGDEIEYKSLGKSTGLYAAAGDTICVPWVSEDPKDFFLAVRGRVVDKLTWVGGDHVKYGPIHGLIHRLRQAHCIIGELARVSDSYPTGETFSDVWWRTLVANKTEECLPVPQGFGDGLLLVDHNIQDFCKFLLSMPPAQTKAQLANIIGLPYYRAMYACYTVHQIAVTETGLLVLAPLLAEAGDQICILNGGAVPFVLKSRKRPLRGYQLVGECYIHGLMNGEGMQGEYEVREICLY